MENLDMYFGTKENADDMVCITYFRAGSLKEAKEIAQEINLKDFAKIGRIYIKGTDF